MIHAQNSKWLLPVLPVKGDNADLAFIEIDTLGWDYLEIVLGIGVSDDEMETNMLITHGDASGSGHVTLPGTVWETALTIDGDATVYPDASDDGKLFGWQINLKDVKRYIDATITVADATLGVHACVMARLSRAENAPTTSAEAGFEALVRV